MAVETTSKITFFSKKESTCPVCGTAFLREDLLTGRGRLIAGELSGDLRRSYEASSKFGSVYPLNYPMAVCPSCMFALFPPDFFELTAAARSEIEQDTDSRIRSIQLIFRELDFNEPRTLNEGAASYYLAMRCYDSMPPEASPTIKKAICAIRAAWLFQDLHRSQPVENFDYLASMFFRKACFFYNLAVEYEENGTESVGSAANLGPDLDKNYGYDGVLYLAAYLQLQYGQRGDAERRAELLRKAKTVTARLFGMGKATRQKPSPLLDKARALYELIGAELQGDDTADGEQS